MNEIVAMAAQAAMESLAEVEDVDRRDSDRLCAVALALVLCHLERDTND